jgi:hypothetical protein
MQVPSESEASRHVASLLHEWTEEEVCVDEARVCDVRIQVGNETLVAEYRRASDIATVAHAIEHLKDAAESEEGIPLLVVPYMGAKGAERCKTEGVGWVDLSGNAHLRTGSLLIHVEGRPNEYKQKGRPTNPFAPKSSRISRFLLAHPNQRFRQKEIAEEADVGRGWTSKVVRRLEEKGLVRRGDDKRVGVPDPSLLLDAWHEKYDFSKHRVTKGTVAAKDSVSLTRRLASAFDSASIEYAATGLSAAWLLTRFAQFRITTLYLSRPPEEDLKREISLREDPKGANVWLVVPNDEGVFYGSSVHDGISHVHPVQVYLDLKGHPERSEEAAGSIRKECFDWTNSNG